MADNEVTTELLTTDTDSVLEVRDLAKREIGIRIVPWDQEVSTPQGREVFRRGAFADVDPKRVVLRMDHQNPPAGRGLSLEEREDGAYMAFRVSQTQRGDEILTLAADGVATGASVGFFDVPGGTEVVSSGGRRTRVVTRADLREVSTTWIPTYPGAEVQYVRANDEENPSVENTPVETPQAPTIDITPVNTAIEGMSAAMQRSVETLTERLTKIEERQRSDIAVPNTRSASERPHRGEWMQTVLRLLAGDRVPDMQLRALDDLITSDNVGVVPPAYSSEIIGVIDPRRPFLNSTRRIATPDAGMSLIVPRIVTRPTVAKQSTQKSEVDSTATSIDTVTYNAITLAGAGDISLQLLRRSSPSFLGLYLELLAEAYASEAEDEALDNLLTDFGDPGDVNDGGTFDPEAAMLGDAWANGFAAMRRGPDTIWLSSAAVGAFIDAKADGTNMPLYASIQSGFSASGGTGGTILGLRPIHVPALDATAVDVLVGPGAGFAWAEDGTYTLQVDVPAKAGRDVALVGILWFAALYRSAFTGYALAGS